MLELQEITLDKKDIINKYLARRCSQNSEFTFTNLFMWRKGYDMKYVIIDDMLCIMPKHVGGPRSATFPIGFKHSDGKEYDIKPVIDKLLEYFKETSQTPLIRLYNEYAVEKLIQAYPNTFLVTEDRSDEDYVYNVSDLINLSGKKYHGKKNHVNKFKKLYNWEYSRMTISDRAECIELFDTWCDNKQSEMTEDDIKGMHEEREAVHELFDNWEALDIVGGCIRVDGKMVAFSFGEPLCEKTAVIHLEHADTAYEGSFSIINQQFLENEWSDYELVNREEDMGIEGLRRAKESYKPVAMVKKYIATLL